MLSHTEKRYIYDRERIYFRTLKEVTGENAKGSQFIRLYRAVDPGEYGNIESSNEFNMSGSTGNMQKYFAPTQEEAILFGEDNFANNPNMPEGQRYGVVSGDFPRSLIDQGEETGQRILLQELSITAQYEKSASLVIC